MQQEQKSEPQQRRVKWVIVGRPETQQAANDNAERPMNEKKKHKENGWADVIV